MTGPKDSSATEPEAHAKDSNPIQELEGNSVTAILKPFEKKALFELKTKLQEAIINHSLFALSHNEISTEKKTQDANGDGRDLKHISIWGVPLLPSKNHEGTDVVLLKFLRARDFKVLDAFEMLRRTLIWRKESRIDGILAENVGSYLDKVAYMNGTDKEGHPVCYNIYGVFKYKETYSKAFGSEEKCDEFLRWRVQLMEKGIQELNFRPGGVSTMVQVSDLKHSPGPDMKELRATLKQVLSVLQDNYPEFVAKNIFINVPFRSYVYNAMFSRLLTQRAKSKCIFARPSKVQETLLKYIEVENLPAKYGGLQRENDDEFSGENNKVSERAIKGGGTETIEILLVEAGVTVVWDMVVVGWEVMYMEEFIPDDDCSYRILIQKERKMEESVRNSFHITEPGKVVLTVENKTSKKKRLLYRFKIKPTEIPLYTFFK
ncbi:hypothetical protein ACLOJK_002622 [Asimina triloba]